MENLGIGQEVKVHPSLRHKKAGCIGYIVDIDFDVVTIEFYDEPEEYYQFENDTLVDPNE